MTSIEDFAEHAETILEPASQRRKQDALRALQEALCQADSQIFRAASHPQWKGMGTTLTLAFAIEWRLYVAHAGDSRCYLYSGEKLQQLTQDHTMTAKSARRGIISAEMAARHPWRHVVTNTLGGQEQGVQVRMHSLDLHADDVLLLCSDGLTEMVSDGSIAAILQNKNDPRRRLRKSGRRGQPPGRPR